MKSKINTNVSVTENEVKEMDLYHEYVLGILTGLEDSTSKNKLLERTIKAIGLTYHEKVKFFDDVAEDINNHILNLEA